jgi:hypothetical protein
MPEPERHRERQIHQGGEATVPHTALYDARKLCPGHVRGQVGNDVDDAAVRLGFHGIIPLDGEAKTVVMIPSNPKRNFAPKVSIGSFLHSPALIDTI